LSGITRSTKGNLRVRNRIYHSVFDARWILSNMPDAELRRQRAAFKRGVIGATALVAVLMLPSPPTHTMMHSWSSSAVRATRSGLKAIAGSEIKEVRSVSVAADGPISVAGSFAG